MSENRLPRRPHRPDYQVIAGKPAALSADNPSFQAVERQNYLQKIHDALHAALDTLHESGVTDIHCSAFSLPRFDRESVYNIASGEIFWNGRGCDVNLMSYAMPRNPKHTAGRPALQRGQCVMSIIDTVDTEEGSQIAWDVYAPWHNKSMPSMDFTRWFVKCRDDEPDLEGMPFLDFMKGYNISIKAPYYDFKPYNRPNPFSSTRWVPSRQRRRLARLATLKDNGGTVDISPPADPTHTGPTNPRRTKPQP
jgi:hypothetical protein